MNIHKTKGGRANKSFKAQAQIAQPKFLIGKTQAQIAQENYKIGKAQAQKSIERTSKLHIYFQNFNKAQAQMCNIFKGKITRVYCFENQYRCCGG